MEPAEATGKMRRAASVIVIGPSIVLACAEAAMARPPLEELASGKALYQRIGKAEACATRSPSPLSMP